MPDGKGYTITFDGVASTTIPEFICHRVRRGAVGSSRTEFKLIPGFEGAWVYPEKRGPRRITIEASVLAPTFPGGRRDAVTAVADWLDKPGLRSLQIGDETNRYYMAVLTSEMEVDEWRELGKFSLEFTALPYAYSTSISTQSLSLVPNAAASTFTIPDGVDAYPVIELAVPSGGGDLTSFDLVVNGRTLSYGNPIVAGNTITISSLAFVTIAGANPDLTLTGAFDPNTVAMNNVSGQFPILHAATTQSVRLLTGGSGPTVTATIKWRRRYR